MTFPLPPTSYILINKNIQSQDTRFLFAVWSAGSCLSRDTHRVSPSGRKRDPSHSFLSKDKGLWHPTIQLALTVVEQKGQKNKKSLEKKTLTK